MSQEQIKEAIEKLEKTNIRERADDIWAFQKEACSLSYDQQEAIKRYSCLLHDAAKIIEQALAILRPLAEEPECKTCKKLASLLLEKDSMNSAIEHCQSCSKTDCDSCDGILSEEWTSKSPDCKPEEPKAVELKVTLHNKEHQIAGFFRLKDGWIQFATKDKPNDWAWPCSFRWDHHHCDIIDRQAEQLQKLKGGHEHPEDFCDLCGGRNIVWHADNKLWNEVVEKEYHRGVIWCPICFVEIAEKQGTACTSWRISRDANDPLVDKLRLEIDRQAAELKEKQDAD